MIRSNNNKGFQQFISAEFAGDKTVLAQSSKPDHLWVGDALLSEDDIKILLSAVRHWRETGRLWDEPKKKGATMSYMERKRRKVMDNSKTTTVSKSGLY